MNFTSISLSEFCIFKMAVPQGVITRAFQGNYTGKSELTKCLNQQELLQSGSEVYLRHAQRGASRGGH